MVVKLPVSDRYLTSIGDVNDPGFRGGSPHNLLVAGRETAFISGGWSLYPAELKNRRVVWNLKELCCTGRRGGYQYTLDCAKRLLEQIPEAQKDGEVISTFPVFPPIDWVSGPVNFYIDATLAQLFGEYGKGPLVSRRVQREALGRERRHYKAATHICCMSSWPARSLLEDYGVPAEKIHIVTPGANIDLSPEYKSNAKEFAQGSTLVLGFIGKNWRRKNLRFLLKVAEKLDEVGVPAVVRAAGFDPADGPRHRLLQSIGFIDKREQMTCFVEFIESLHFGCLFSHAEASAIFSVECLRLGVPVLTWRVGGMIDLVPVNCGRVFEKDVSASHVADWIAAIAADPARYAAMLRTIKADPARFTWRTVVERMQAVWAGSNTYSYARLMQRG